MQNLGENMRFSLFLCICACVCICACICICVSGVYTWVCMAVQMEEAAILLCHYILHPTETGFGFLFTWTMVAQ